MTYMHSIYIMYILFHSNLFANPNLQSPLFLKLRSMDFYNVIKNKYMVRIFWFLLSVCYI